MPPRQPPSPPPSRRSPEGKGQLHPRNRHQGRYDFPALLQAHPALARFVIRNPYGKPSIDFADPAAVRTFNRALLAQLYGLHHWDIPDGYLCPPVPGRADYLHGLADVLATSNAGIIPRGEQVRVLDIELWSFLVYGEIEGWRILLIDSGKNHNQQRMIRHDPVYPESAFTTRRTGNRSADRVVTQRCTRVDRTSR